MADKEAKLRLVITAQNEASPAFTTMTGTLKQTQKAVTEVADSFTTAFKDIVASARAASEALSGSTTGVTNSLKDESKVVSEVARGVAESFKSMGQSSVEASQEIGRAVQDDERSIRGLEETAQTMPNAFRIAAEAITQSMREITTSSEGTTRGMESSFQSIEHGISSVTMAIRNQTSQITAAMHEMESGSTGSIRNLGHALQDAGVLISLQQIGSSMEHVGGAGEHLFLHAVQQSADFESSLSGITAALYATGMPMQQASNMTDQLKDKALELGTHYHRSATEIADAMDAFVRQGVSGQAVLDGVGKAAVQVSLVTKQDLGETAKVMADIFNEFRDQFEKNGKSMEQNMQEVANGMTGSLLRARIPMQTFLDTMKYAGPLAGILGIQFRDLAAAISVMAQHGVTGSQAGTTLRRVFTNLIAPTKGGAAALQELGLATIKYSADGKKAIVTSNALIDSHTGKMKSLVEVQSLLSNAFSKLTATEKIHYAQMIFGQYALTGTSILVNKNAKDFQELDNQLKNVSAETAAGIMMNNLSGDLMLLHANWETLLKMLGDTVHPVMRSIAAAIDSIVQGLSHMNPVMKEAIMWTLGIGSALAVAGVAITSFVAYLGFLKMGLFAMQGVNPFTSLITGMQGTTAAAGALATAETAATVATEEATVAAGALAIPFGQIAVVIGAVTAAVALLVVAWKNDFGGIREITTTVWNDVKSIFTASMNAITPIVQTGITVMKTAWDGLSYAVTHVQETYQRLKDGAITVVNNAINELSATVEKHKVGLETTAVILGTIFGPALIKLGVEAAAAGVKLAAQLTVKVIELSVQAGVTAVSITAKLITSIVTLAAQSIATGAKMVAGIIAATVKLAMEATATALVITGRMIVALAAWAAQGWTTAAMVVASTANINAMSIATVALAAKQAIVTTATRIWTAAQIALDAALDANPIGAVILAITALGAAIYELIIHFKDLIGWVEKAWNWLTKWNSTPAENKSINVNTNYTKSGSVDSAVANYHNIPQYATGGVVDRPTLALVGEGGEREFIIPESKLGNANFLQGLGLLGNVSNGGGGTDRWAGNFVDMFANGLNNSKQKVKDASYNLANQMALNLGFHSPTADGPASDSNQWAPNFVQMFSQGLTDGAPKVQTAATTLITPLKDTVTSVIDSTKSAVDSGVTAISDKISSMKDALSNVFSAIKTAADDMQNGMTAAFDTIATKAEDAANRIVAAMQQAQSAMASMSSMSVSGGGYSSGGGGSGHSGLDNTKIGSDGLTDKTRQERQDAIDRGGQTADHFSFLADGGVVTRPTKAIIGEGGEPEYAIPQSRLEAGVLPLPKFGRGNGGVTIQIGDIIVNGAGNDGKGIGRNIADSLRQQLSFAL